MTLRISVGTPLRRLKLEPSTYDGINYLETPDVSR